MLALGGQCDQGLEVIAEDLGGEVLEHCLVRQARDVFEIQAMLEPLEGHLNAPPLVVEITEDGGGKALGIEQVGHQHPYLAVGGHMTDQAHPRWCGRTVVVDDVAAVGRRQVNDLFAQARAAELSYAGESALATQLHPHTEADAALIERSHQPPAGVAAIEQQQVLGAESLEVLEEHLALAFVNTMQGGSEHNFAPREIEAEGDLIGTGGAWHVAGAQPEAHRGGIGGHQAQALPASEPASQPAVSAWAMR